MCFDFLCKFVWNISHSKKNSARRDRSCVGLRVKYPLSLSDFNGIWIFFDRFFVLKYSNIKFHENPSSGPADLLHADRRTDRYDEVNIRFSQISWRA